MRQDFITPDAVHLRFRSSELPTPRQDVKSDDPVPRRVSESFEHCGAATYVHRELFFILFLPSIIFILTVFSNMWYLFLFRFDLKFNKTFKQNVYKINNYVEIPKFNLQNQNIYHNKKKKRVCLRCSFETINTYKNTSSLIVKRHFQTSSHLQSHKSKIYCLNFK